MRLPRTETTLAAVLLLSAAPFALAAPTGASPPDTPGVTAPATSPSTTNPGMSTPSATPPGATTRSGAQQGTETPGASTAQYQGRQMGSGSPTPSSGWSRHPMRSAERVPKADIEAAKSAKVSLTDAIDTAQQQNHGDVLAARFELRHGRPEYLIRTFDSQSRKEWLGHVDARTGKIIGQGKSIAVNELPKEDRKELTASTAGTSLAQAVQTAEQQRGGKALAAGLSARNGQVEYRTELLKSNGKTQMAMINPESGHVSGSHR